jgi:hypothetical protein
MYNFARKTGDRLEGFEELIPYILGNDAAPDRRLLVLFGVFVASAAEAS